MTKTRTMDHGGEVKNRASFSDKAYGEVKDRILNNQMPAGFQATEQEIAELLDMSRTPVREALIRLQNEGLVEIRPRHGMRVLPVSAEDMREIYEILLALESTAAGLVAARGLGDDELEALNRAVVDMEEALERDDLPAWAEADQTFHQLLIEFCGNQRLQTLVNTFMEQSHRCRMLTLRLRPKPTKSNADHAAVVQAIRDGDSDEARRCHRLHRERSGEMIVKLLTDYGLTQV